MKIRVFLRTGAALVAGAAILAGAANAQWTNHYPKLDDFGHHVYLEQYELPFLAAGPTAPAPSPDGRHIAFAAKGWIWLLDIESGIAERLTDGAEMDSRPRWSRDGDRLTFVRDSGSDTSVIIRDMATGRESVIDSPGIELDPEFSADSTYLYYTSAQDGVLSLWKRHIDAGTEEKLTDLRQVERNARVLADGSGLVYLHSAYPVSSLRLRDFRAGTDEALNEINLPPLLAADVHPSERTLVYTAPQADDHHLMLADLARPGITRQLTNGETYALMPAFSGDGSMIYYVTPDENQQFNLMRIPTAGGKPEAVEIASWDYGQPTGSMVVTTTDEDGSPLPARLSITDGNGHPVANPDGPTYFDPQHGRVYFYADGSVDLGDVLSGRYEITAVHGPMSIPVTTTARVSRGSTAEASLAITTIWDADGAGYVSADHHIHLNADGPHRMTPGDLLPLMAGEDLDQVAPMAWNRYSRQVDEFMVGDRVTERDMTVAMSQEVRSNFHGHVGLIGVGKPFYPWYFGPDTPRFGSPDRSNGEVIAYAAETGALATYVHSVGSHDDPFAEDMPRGIPLEMISDTVLSPETGIELVCMWTSPLGTAEVWYRLLNIGQPTPATSGTDMMSDFTRAPAIGTARVYARAENGTAFDAILDQVRAGKTFLSTGPALLFEIAGAEPGETVASGEQDWKVTLASAAAVEKLEIIVNGEVVETLEGVSAGETRVYEGSVTLPEGGWIAARAHGGEPAWPSMAVTRFAHSSPVWIGEIGSTDPAAKAAAASDLLRALDAAEARAKTAYDQTPTPRLMARFKDARQKLQAMAGAE
ncbi:CehA/McbA family metallohydrolase [Aquisalinus flavus]|nr:CehA/McbA family metallohydrolase [Aquisalinus flavus]MBD0426883.1 CehA/McbA family metallohydrolase [Aquisalinus flavus]